MTAGQGEAVLVAPALRDLSVLAEQLGAWLSKRLPGASDIRLDNFSYPFGAGQSHETILFDAAWAQDGKAHGRGLVVRIKPTTFTVYQDDMFTEQYEIMSVAHASGLVPVAEPLWFEADPSVLGAPFFVMEKIVGRVAVSIPSYMEVGWVIQATEAERRRLWRNSVTEFAAIQKIPLSSLQFLARPDLGDGFDQEIDRWRRFLTMIEAVRPLPFYARTWSRLMATAPSNRPPGLVWGDARLGNMLVGSDYDILAVMDWEQPSLGGALQDLGWWLFNERMKILARGSPLPGFGSREETIELWRSLTGVSTQGLDWYEAFAGFKMSCLAVNMLDMRGQRPPEDDYARIGSCIEIDRMLTEMESRG